MDYKERYNDLLYQYKRLEREHNELKEKYRKLDSELDSAKYKIRNELEPRIKREERAYDAWVTNPGRCE